MAITLGERISIVRAGEWSRLSWAGAFFFFILFGYFLLRPAREALGVQSGMDTVRVLYLGTLVATALLNPVFALIVSRLPRRRFVPLTYRFFMLNIVAFAALLQFFPDDTGDSTGRVYFVWLTVFALFNTMVFWAVMSDTFTLEQSKRLYPLIAVGGTLGALAGSMLSWTIASALASGLAGSTISSSAALLLVSLVFFECALLGYRRLGRLGSLPSNGNALCESCGLGRIDPETNACDTCRAPYRRADKVDNVIMGGSVWQGLSDVARSPYLAAICGYILMMTIISTVFYFTRLHIVADATQGDAARTALFANINIWTQLATLTAQLLLTGRLILGFGVGPTLSIVPLFAAAGVAAVAIAPTYAMITMVTALYDAGRYAIARPTRETLFTVVNREQRYKAKAVIDTLVYRAGDVVGVGGDLVMRMFASSAAAAAFVAIPICALWTGLAIYLGRRQRALAETPTNPSRPHSGPSTPGPMSAITHLSFPPQMRS